MTSTQTPPPGWTVQDGRLVRDVKLADFAEALDLVNRIGALAEERNHHPDLLIHSWNRVRISLYTHTTGAITDNDYNLAGEINPLIPGSA